MTPQERLRAIGMIQVGLSHRQVAVTLNCDHGIIDRLLDLYIWTGMTKDKPHRRVLGDPVDVCKR